MKAPTTAKPAPKKSASKPAPKEAVPKKPRVLKRDRPVAPSPHGGMGAVVVRDGVAPGVSFRVWAPHATAVRVTGTFSNWEGGPEMARENEAGYWSVFVPKAEAGAEYKYALDTPDGTLHRNDPYARGVTNSVGNSVVYDDAAFDWEGDEAFAARPWNELVVYEAHGGTFFGQPFARPAEASGGEPARWSLTDHARHRLDGLAELGITAIELMPLAEFAGDQSWGYNPAHPFAVESAYGGPDALKALVREAHARGIAVIADVVYNHLGPSDLDLWRFDGWSENDKGGIYFYNDERSSTPWGDTRPDYGREEVRRYLRDNSLMWLQAYHMDGLRFDMALYIRNRGAFVNPEDELGDGWKLLQEINADVAALRAATGRPYLTVAEDLQRYEGMTVSHEVGGAGFGSQWDAAFVHPVRAALEAPTDAERSMGAIAGALAHRYGDDAFARVVYTESHDEVANGRQRVFGEIKTLIEAAGAPGDRADELAARLAALGLVLTLTAPGIPMLFQGQAALADGWFDDGSDAERLHRAEHEGPSHRALVRDLVRLRLGGEGATRGLTAQGFTLLHADDDAKVIAYARHDGAGADGETVVVLHFAEAPLDDYAVPFPGVGAWRLVFNAGSPLYDGALGTTLAGDVEARAEPYGEAPARADMALGPYGALVFAR